MHLERICVLPIGAILTGLFAASAMAQGAVSPHGSATVVVREVGAVPVQESPAPRTFSGDVAADLPASITQPSGVLTLAPAGIQTLPARPATGRGCNACPGVRCRGPIYPSCSPRIYYGTDPGDDDPILSLSPQIHHGKPQPWYTAAFNLVLRKQAVTEAIK